MAVVITTKSSTDADLDNRIYPCFEDRLAYTSWINPDNVVSPTVSNCSFPYFQFKATGGPITLWQVISGALPKGITLDEATGRASGTPTKIGLFKFTLKATNGAGEFITKDLEWETKPFRGREMAKVPYAPIRQWGKSNYPYIAKNFFDSTSTPAQKGGVNVMVKDWTDNLGVFHPGWESQLTVDHEANAAYDEALGLKFAEVIMGFDLGMFRPAPAPTTATRYDDQATFNHVKAYADAYHARGMRIGMYIAPNYIYNIIPGETGSAAFALTDGDLPFGNWASVQKQYLVHWVKNKWLDYAMIDVGAAWDYYVDGFANPGAFPILSFIPYFRFFHEDFCFCVNPGTRTGDCLMGGSQVHFPHADGYIFEATKSSTTSEIAYEVGTPPMPRKKVFIYEWQMPSETFGHGPNSVGSIMKNLPGTKRVMEMGWENGCTFAAAHPVASTGVYPTPYFKDYFEELAAHALASGGYSEFCEFDYERGKLTITSDPKETIYYTTDGTYPTKDSPVYTGPIVINKPTYVKARSKHPNKLMGHMEEGLFGTEYEQLSLGKMSFNISTIKNATFVTDPANSFRGQHIAVFNKDIIIDEFGRQGTATIPHEMIVKRRADEFNMFFSRVEPTAPLVDGYQWLDARGLRLKAGSLYWMGFKEGTVDTYASNTMAINPQYNADDYRIKGNAVGSPLGDLMPLVDNLDWYQWWSVGGNYNIGQFINMKYRTVENGDPALLHDFLLGRDAVANTNAGGPVSINGGIRVATCANNNLPHTFASVGGVYEWTWGGLFEKPRWINRVEVEFRDEFALSTQMNLYCMMNQFAAASGLVATKLDNKSVKVTFTFPKRFCNRVYLMSLLPNGPGQFGGGMALERVSAYLK